jgi:hypothetical protein
MVQQSNHQLATFFCILYLPPIRVSWLIVSKPWWRRKYWAFLDCMPCTWKGKDGKDFKKPNCLIEPIHPIFILNLGFNGKGYSSVGKTYWTPTPTTPTFLNLTKKWLWFVCWSWPDHPLKSMINYISFLADVTPNSHHLHA